MGLCEKMNIFRFYNPWHITPPHHLYRIENKIDSLPLPPPELSIALQIYGKETFSSVNNSDRRELHLNGSINLIHLFQVT